MPDSDAPLVLVSNRGPVTFQEDGSVKRGTGGLVTALTGLASHRDAVWIASAMTDGDVERGRSEHGGAAVRGRGARRRRLPRRFVESDAEAYDRFYNIFANPMLWFIQHYLWDQSNAPDIRRHEVEAFEFGYNVVNEDLARGGRAGDRGPGRAGRDGPRLPPLHAAGDGPRGAARTSSCTTSSTSRGRSRTPGACCRRKIRDEIYRGLLANDIVGFHTRSYRRNFLQCCRDLMDLEVDLERGVVHFDDREVWVRAYPLPIDYEATRGVADARARARVRGASCCGAGATTRSCASTARTCPRTSCAGSPAFDIFLEQHPEFAERITFTAQLMPSRTDVPEYAEYLEKIEALVAVVNHRHGTPDWMPIDLKLRDDLERGGRLLQALRRDDGQRDVRRHEPGGQGGAAGQRAQRRLDPEREHRRARGARRVRAVGEPVRRAGARRLDLRRADDGPGRARAARRAG